MLPSPPLPMASPRVDWDEFKYSLAHSWTICLLPCSGSAVGPTTLGHSPSQGFVLHTWHLLGPKKTCVHMCKSCYGQDSRSDLLYHLQIRGEGLIGKFLLTQWVVTVECKQWSCWDFISFVLLFFLFCFLLNSELLEHWDWISFLTKSSLSNSGLASTHKCFESISFHLHELHLIMWHDEIKLH